MAPRSSVSYAAVVKTGYAVEGTFYFFRLPRELRNSIYDNLLLGSKVRIRQHQFGTTRTWAYLLNGSRSRHLLVNRQFHNELQERTSKVSSLALIQARSFPGQPLMMPWRVHVSLVELHLGVALASHLHGEDLEKQMGAHADEVINVICSRHLPFKLDLYVAPAELVEEGMRIIADKLDLLVSKEARALTTSLKIWQITLLNRLEPQTSKVSATLAASYSHLTGKLHCAATNEIYGGDNNWTETMAE